MRASLLGLLVICALGVVIFPEKISTVTRDSFFAPERKQTKLLFVGDIMLDRSVREYAETHGYPYIFDSIREYIQSFDAVIGNLEGPITDNPSLSLGTTRADQPGNMTFTFSPEVASVLKAENITLVTIANNHILDFGRDGFEQTKLNLDSAGVLWVGNPYGGTENVRYVTYGDTEFAFVSFNQFLGRDIDETVALIADAQNRADVVVVLAHWGEEYALEQVSYVVPWAHAFIDAGADTVIGSHPHVIEPFEEYKGGRIYYSLGNFVFDQYWEPNVRCGLGVEMAVTKHESSVDIMYSEIRFGLERSRQTVIGCTD